MDVFGGRVTECSVARLSINPELYLSKPLRNYVLFSSVDIIKSDDVIFPKIASRLNLNKFKRKLSRVMKTVDATQR